MNEHEIRLRALELVVERRADWQTTDQVIATAGAYADFVLGAARDLQNFGTAQEPLKFLGTMPELQLPQKPIPQAPDARLGHQTERVVS